MSKNDQENGTTPLAPSKRRRGCKVCTCVSLILLLLIVLLVIILAFTLFKVKQPKIQVTSTTVEGVAPRLTFPAIKIELNITLNLTILVYNPNRVSFKAGLGSAQLVYKGEEVGNAVVDPGDVPAKGSASFVCGLTLEADRFADDGLMALVRDVMDGEVDLGVKTRIPGKAKILFFKKHVVTSSDCQVVIGFPDVEIKSQDCKQHTKL